MLTSWPPPSQTDLIVKVTTDGLAGVYDASVRLGRAELFHDGWQPMLEPAAMRHLLADLACLGDEPAQVAALGWTLRPADDGQVELVEANLPADQIEQVDGRFRLPRECGFTVVGELPPLGQLYRSLTLLEAYAYGPTDQLVEPEQLLAQPAPPARRSATSSARCSGSPWTPTPTPSAWCSPACPTRSAPVTDPQRPRRNPSPPTSRPWSTPTSPRPSTPCTGTCWPPQPTR